MIPETIRVATYNIHSGVGSDGRRSLQRILDVIHSLQPDVIALQEVGSLNNYEEGKHQFRILEESGFRLLAGPVGPGYYGNALLVRLPVLEQGLQALSYEDREPRGLLHARLQTSRTFADRIVGPPHQKENPPRGAFQVFATHLGLRNRERWQQVRQIKDFIERRTMPHEPWLLMGDMNIWFPFSAQIRYLKQNLHLRWHRARTFPSRFPLLSLDRLALSSHWHVMHEGRLRDKVARKASDHLPFYMDLALSDHLPQP